MRRSMNKDNYPVIPIYGVELTLEGGKWGVGGGREEHDVSGVGLLGSGACSWDLHDFTLVVLPAKSENRNFNWSKYARESRFQRSRV